MRIIFNEHDAERIFEWKLAMNQLCGPCCENCSLIEKRIEKFIGDKAAKKLKRLVKKHPYQVKVDTNQQ